MPATWSAARCVTSSSGARRPTGTSRPMPGRTSWSTCSRTPCTRTASGPWPSAATARCSRSRRSGPTTTTRTSGGRIASSSATRSSSTSLVAISRATRWPGGARRAWCRLAERPSSWTRTAAPRMSTRGSSERSATHHAGSRRTRSAWSERSGSRPPSASASSRRRSTAIRARADLVRHLSGERIAAELDKLLAAERPSIGLRLMLRHGPPPGDLARAGRPARDPAEQGPGRGPLGPHAADRRRGSGRSAGRPVGGAPA